MPDNLLCCNTGIQLIICVFYVWRNHSPMSLLIFPSDNAVSVSKLEAGTLDITEASIKEYSIEAIQPHVDVKRSLLLISTNWKSRYITQSHEFAVY